MKSIYPPTSPGQDEDRGLAVLLPEVREPAVLHVQGRGGAGEAHPQDPLPRVQHPVRRGPDDRRGKGVGALSAPGPSRPLEALSCPRRISRPDGRHRGHGAGPHRALRRGPGRRDHHPEGGHEGGGPDRDGDREVRRDPGRLPRDRGYGHRREGPVPELQGAEGLRPEQPRADHRREGHQNINGRDHLQGIRKPEAHQLRVPSWSSGGRSMDKEERLKTILDVLDQLAEDTSVPRNIRRGATEAKNRLVKKEDALDLRVQSAIVIMDDLANDPNLPLHGRTQIWNIISALETVKP